jgi:DNA-binding HxlR family transcriptional regulator
MKALRIVGERWTLLVIREAFFGVRRFEALLVNVGCARNLLARRLVTLVDHDVLAKVPYLDEQGRQRFEYRLTEKGHALFPVIVALMHWGDAWLPRSGPVPVTLTHRECGQPVVAELRCAAGHLVPSARAVEAEWRGVTTRSTRRATPRSAPANSRRRARPS